MKVNPKTRKLRLLLVGSGHSHIEVLRQFGASPLADADITLVTPQTTIVYSGMVPGLVAGHYSPEQAHISVQGLASLASVRLVRAKLVSLDLKRKSGVCEDRR